MEQKRSTRLVLKTSDLTVNSTTNIGQCDQYRQNFTWFNIRNNTIQTSGRNTRYFTCPKNIYKGLSNRLAAACFTNS